MREQRLAYPANREGVCEHFPDPSVRKSIEVDLALPPVPIIRETTSRVRLV